MCNVSVLGETSDRYNVFFVVSATSLSHNGILIRDLVQILVGEVGIVWILIEFGSPRWVESCKAPDAVNSLRNSNCVIIILKLYMLGK